jgi:DNA replication protein DnaC
MFDLPHYSTAKAPKLSGSNGIKIIRHRYENKSTDFTTNRNFEDWRAILGDKVMASAIIDRIVRHTHILKFSGGNYRIKDFLTRLNNID